MLTEDIKGVSLALGTFDGFHLGHMAVIEAAKKSQYPMAALLFDEHPLKAITGVAPPELVCCNVLYRLRSQYDIPAYHLEFSEIMNMSAEEFFYEILTNEIDVRELSCGENYTFGKGGRGDVTLLKKLCEENGVKLNVVPTVMYKGEPISSTRIRKAIENGEMEDADQMLGRPFSYCFPIVDGDKRGHKLGFPTANQLLPDNLVKLKRGVYASACYVDGELYPAVTNYGVRPTVDGTKCISETHIIGFEGDLYSRLIEVFILSYIREERKFPDLEALSSAVSRDVETSLEIFAKYLENEE